MHHLLGLGERDLIIDMDTIKAHKAVSATLVVAAAAVIVSCSSSGGTTNYYSLGEKYVAKAYADGDTSPSGWTAETWCANTIFAQQGWPNMTQIIDQVPTSGPGEAQFANGCEAGWAKTYG